MKHLLVVSLLLSTLALTACQTNYEDMTDAQRDAFSHSGSSYTYKPDPNAPVQVTYRIDDYRFVTLENYDHCFGDNYYNNTRLGIHQKVWTGVATDYRGRLIIDDRSGTNVVLPTARNSTCGDRGCKVRLYYSTDSGKTFNTMPYMNSFDPSRDSEKYAMFVAKDSFLIEQLISKDTGNTSTDRYPLIPNFIYGTGQKLPDNQRVESNVQMRDDLRTPSGQDRFTCDNPIRPSDLRKPQ